MCLKKKKHFLIFKDTRAVVGYKKMGSLDHRNNAVSIRLTRAAAGYRLSRCEMEPNIPLFPNATYSHFLLFPS